MRDYQKKYHKKYYAAKKLDNKNKNLNKMFKNNLFSLIIIKEYNRIKFIT